MNFIKKYIGKYRVVCEFCRDTLQPIKDDTYITCTKNGQIFRIHDNILAYHRPTRGNSEEFCKKLIDVGVKSVENRSTDGDMLIRFAEESIEIVAEKVGAITAGVNTNPTSVRNLRKLSWFKKNKQCYIDKGLYRELTEEEKEMARERFSKNINKDKE